MIIQNEKSVKHIDWYKYGYAIKDFIEFFEISFYFQQNHNTFWNISNFSLTKLLKIRGNYIDIR